MTTPRSLLQNQLFEVQNIIKRKETDFIKRNYDFLRLYSMDRKELEKILNDLATDIGHKFFDSVPSYTYDKLYEFYTILSDELILRQLDKRVGLFLYYTEEDKQNGKINIKFCQINEELEEMKILESFKSEITFIPGKEKFIKV